MQRFRIGKGNILAEIQQLDAYLRPEKTRKFPERPDDYVIQNGILIVEEGRFAHSLSRIKKLHAQGDIGEVRIVYPTSFSLRLVFGEYALTDLPAADVPQFGEAFIQKQGPASSLAVSSVAFIGGSTTTKPLGTITVEKDYAPQAVSEKIAAMEAENTPHDWLKKYLDETRVQIKPSVTHTFNTDALSRATGELSDPATATTMRFFDGNKKGSYFVIARPDAPWDTASDFIWQDYPYPESHQDGFKQERLQLSWDLAAACREKPVRVIAASGHPIAIVGPVPETV